MRSRRGSDGGGFTMVELVLALGVAAGGIVVTLAILVELVALAARASEARQLYGREDLVRLELRRRTLAQDGTAFLERLPAWQGGESPAEVLLVRNPESEAAARFPVELWRWATGVPEGDLVIVRSRGAFGGELVFATKVRVP